MSQYTVSLSFLRTFQLENDTDISYVDRTATGSSDVGQDSYFDNFTIMQQFERLLKLLEFKEQYKNLVIECVVDNLRMHSAKLYSLLNFGKSIETRCLVDKIEYTDAQEKQKIANCYFQDGPNRRMSNGLLNMAEEFKVKLPSKIKLEKLRTALSDGPAFKTASFYTLINLLKLLMCKIAYRFFELE